MDVEQQRIRKILLQGSESVLSALNPETVYFVESELIEDHLEGTLTESESELFVTNFLVTAERKDHLNEIRLLKRFSRDAFEFDASGFDEPSKESTSSTLRIVAIVLVAAITAMIVLLSVRLFQS